MRQRAFEYLLFSLAIGVLMAVFLTGIHVYNRIEAHNALDAAILEILKAQQTAPKGE